MPTQTSSSQHDRAHRGATSVQEIQWDPRPAGELLLINLRLLDIDPKSCPSEIGQNTFRLSDQKRRVQCAEWALYRLLALWDPEETRMKVQPYYPPLEPLQSLNLRAALYRCLDHSKKVGDGLVPREYALRKTMLDDCKGEKFEELLFEMSYAVLTKVVRAGIGQRPLSAVEELAIYRLKPGNEKPAVLVPLIIAHKVSLQNHLVMKSKVRANIRNFVRSLRQTEMVLSQHPHGARSNTRREITLDPELQRVVQENWFGNDEWLKLILGGDDDGDDGDDFYNGDSLSASWSSVWADVLAGDITDLKMPGEEKHLSQFESDVKHQNLSLSRFRKVEETLTKEGLTLPDNQNSKGRKGIDLGFTSTDYWSDKATTEPRSRFEGFGEYQQIVEGLAQKLDNCKAI